jgi:hypothetical protein
MPSITITRANCQLIRGQNFTSNKTSIIIIIIIIITIIIIIIIITITIIITIITIIVEESNWYQKSADLGLN